MKSVIPIAAGVLGVGVIIYIYLRQRDKDKKKKADNNDNNGIPTKVAIESLEFKIDNNLVPLIVGRNSVNLKSIEEKTKTTIKFRECDENNQMCTINGKEDDVKKAKELIDTEAKKQPVITDEILVPTSSCGKIEGYCGTVLHEICQKSSAKIWIDSGSRKNQGENRRVLITGTKEQVELAKKLIDEKIKEPSITEPPQVSDEDLKKSNRGVSPYASNSSITTTESPRELMLPSPEKLKNNDGQLEVFVSAVSSPSRFWVQLCGSQNTELDFLVDAMTEYYSDKENQKLHAIREPYLGQIIAAMLLSDNKWYRAEIVAIQPNESNDLVLDVYFLDYGDHQFVGKKEILELRSDFLSLRFQAIECFLAHIQPVNTGSKFEEWDRKAIEAFEAFVNVAQWKKKLISKVVTYKDRKSFALQRKQRESSPIPGVELYEENSDKNIALELVQMGYAEMSDRFGDLAKSAVLNVIDDNPNNSESREKSPLPAEQVPEQNISKKEEEESYEVEKVVPEPDQSISQNIPEKEPINTNEESTLKSDEKEEAATATVEPSTNDNLERHLLANGDKKSTAPAPESSNSNIFGGNNKPYKSKKKKQQATADFLKKERVDWNTLMDD